MSRWIGEISYFVRLHLRTPASSIVAILVLAVALSIVSASFSLYVDLAVKPHPGLEDGENVATVALVNWRDQEGISQELVLGFDERSPVLESVAGFTRTIQEFAESGESISIELSTRGFFDGLRPRLAIGRGFDPSDHAADAEPVVILSYRFWQERYGGDPDVLNTTIGIVGRPQGFFPPSQAETPPELQFRIIGVMHRTFPGLMGPADLWMPFERAVPLYYNRPGVTTSVSMLCIVRIRSGLTAIEASRQLNDQFAESEELPPGWRFSAISGVVHDIRIHRESIRQLNMFLAGSVLLAIAAAANVSMFMLARAPARRRELGIRMAVGASYRRISWQLCRESIALVSVAAVLGLAASFQTSQLFLGLPLFRQAEWRNITLLDWRVLILVGGVLLAVALIVSIAPLIEVRRIGILQTSQKESARATPMQLIIGSAQLAVAGLLGGAAVMLAFHLASLTLAHPGFETKNRHVMTFAPTLINSIGTASLTNSLIDPSRQSQAILSIPGVSNVSFANAVPGMNLSWDRSIPDLRDANRQFRFQWIIADDAYIGLLGLRVVSGDTRPGSGDAALVNETFAREYFGRIDVVGENILLDTRSGEVFNIVGVLQDLSYEHPAAAIPPMVVTRSQGIAYRLAVIESELGASELQEQIQGRIDAGDIEIRLANIVPTRDLYNSLIAPDRARGYLSIAATAFVIVLTGFGLFGIQRYLVMAGRVEYAIHAALGASPSALGRLVIGRGFLIGMPGLILGTLLAVPSASWAKDYFAVTGFSPVHAAVTVAAGLAGLIVLANFGPARKVRQADPAPLLRES